MPILLRISFTEVGITPIGFKFPELRLQTLTLQYFPHGLVRAVKGTFNPSVDSDKELSNPS